MERINHILPHVGQIELWLYSPADIIFEILKQEGEIDRLDKLLHLGAFSYVIPGSRYTRWDYTVALLYYIENLNLEGFSNNFNFNGINFSSSKAALQTIALCWNIGHIPGTYYVEKGIYRFLYKKFQDRPCNELFWPNINNISDIINKANQFLIRMDYTGLPRVFALLKLFQITNNKKNALTIIENFISPFLLDYNEIPDKRWINLKRAFDIVRHVSYLTLDTCMANIHWIPPVHSLFRSAFNDGKDNSKISIEELSDRVCEILSPIARIVYLNFYYSHIARETCAAISNNTFQFLTQDNDPMGKINDWLKEHSLDKIANCNISHSEKLVHLASINIRSIFLDFQLVKLESSLQKRDIIPLALSYESWNSEKIIEPDEFIISIYSKKDAINANKVGYLILWIIINLDNINAKLYDEFSILQKIDLGKQYSSLICQAFQLTYKNYNMSMRPWEISKFGIFSDIKDVDKCGIWACNNVMDNDIAKYIVRDRSRYIGTDLRKKYAELEGIRELRREIRKILNRSRSKCMLITSSIYINGRDDNDNKIEREFDGGIATISSRSGTIKIYLLETKTSVKSPKVVLEEKIRELSLNYRKIKILSNRHAYAEIVL